MMFRVFVMSDCGHWGLVLEKEKEIIIVKCDTNQSKYYSIILSITIFKILIVTANKNIWWFLENLSK